VTEGENDEQSCEACFEVLLLSGRTLYPDTVLSPLDTVPVVTAGDPPINYTAQAIPSGTPGGQTFTNAPIKLVLAEDGERGSPHRVNFCGSDQGIREDPKGCGQRCSAVHDTGYSGRGAISPSESCC
jgi:hypothetical protein